MADPILELPQNPTRTQVLHAAISADNHCDRLMVEALQWRERAHDLFDLADEMQGKGGQVQLERR
jgi:hypothetical protein